jgi:small subunit ribosomal protein S6
VAGPHLYDLVLMLDPNAPEGRGDQILGDVRSMIESSGTLVGEHDWGLRKMSFEIRHRPEAHYELFQFEGDNDLLQRIDHTLKITDGVLRFRIIRQKPGTPPPPTPRPDAPPRGREREPRGSERVAARAAADADSESDVGADQPPAE